MPITITATTDSPPAHLRALSDFFLELSGGFRQVPGPSREELLTSTALVSEAAAVFGGKPGDPIKGSDERIPLPSVIAQYGGTCVEKIEEAAASVVVPPPPVQSSIAAEVAEIARTAVILDASGLPWDERIHSSSKATTAEGVWRLKRGLNSSVLADVTAELRAKYPMAAPTPAAAAAAPPPPPVVETTVPAPPVAAEVVIPPPPASAATEVPVNFAQLMPHITAELRDKRLNMTQIIEACQAVGVPALPALGGRPDLVPTVFALLFSASDE